MIDYCSEPGDPNAEGYAEGGIMELTKYVATQAEGIEPENVRNPRLPDEVYAVLPFTLDRVGPSIEITDHAEKLRIADAALDCYGKDPNAPDESSDLEFLILRATRNNIASNPSDLPFAAHCAVVLKKIEDQLKGDESMDTAKAEARHAVRLEMTRFAMDTFDLATIMTATE